MSQKFSDNLTAATALISLVIIACILLGCTIEPSQARAHKCGAWGAIQHAENYIDGLYQGEADFDNSRSFINAEPVGDPGNTRVELVSIKGHFRYQGEFVNYEMELERMLSTDCQYRIIAYQTIP